MLPSEGLVQALAIRARSLLSPAYRSADLSLRPRRSLTSFVQHEARMPDEGPDDGSGKQKRHKLVWNRFKWMIFVANTVVRSRLPPSSIILSDPDASSLDLFSSWLTRSSDSSASFSSGSTCGSTRTSSESALKKPSLVRLRRPRLSPFPPAHYGSLFLQSPPSLSVSASLPRCSATLESSSTIAPSSLSTRFSSGSASPSSLLPVTLPSRRSHSVSRVTPTGSGVEISESKEG